MKTIDIETIKFSSTVFPTAEDIALWESLSDQERLAVLTRQEQAAFDSGIAEKASMREILDETRAETKPGL